MGADVPRVVRCRRMPGVHIDGEVLTSFTKAEGFVFQLIDNDDGLLGDLVNVVVGQIKLVAACTSAVSWVDAVSSGVRRVNTHRRAKLPGTSASDRLCSCLSPVRMQIEVLNRRQRQRQQTLSIAKPATTMLLTGDYDSDDDDKDDDVEGEDEINDYEIEDNENDEDDDNNNDDNNDNNNNNIDNNDNGGASSRFVDLRQFNDIGVAASDFDNQSNDARRDSSGGLCFGARVMVTHRGGKKTGPYVVLSLNGRLETAFIKALWDERREPWTVSRSRLIVVTGNLFRVGDRVWRENSVGPRTGPLEVVAVNEAAFTARLRRLWDGVLMDHDIDQTHLTLDSEVSSTGAEATSVTTSMLRESQKVWYASGKGAQQLFEIEQIGRERDGLVLLKGLFTRRVLDHWVTVTRVTPFQQPSATSIVVDSVVWWKHQSHGLTRTGPYIVTSINARNQAVLVLLANDVEQRKPVHLSKLVLVSDRIGHDDDDEMIPLSRTTRSTTSTAWEDNAASSNSVVEKATPESWEDDAQSSNMAKQTVEGWEDLLSDDTTTKEGSSDLAEWRVKSASTVATSTEPMSTAAKRRLLRPRPPMPTVPTITEVATTLPVGWTVANCEVIARVRHVTGLRLCIARKKRAVSTDDTGQPRSSVWISKRCPLFSSFRLRSEC
jgi:hypothetical protein